MHINKTILNLRKKAEKRILLIKNKILKLKREQKGLIIAGIILTIVCFFTSNASIFIAPNTIKREGYGGKSQIYNVLVEGISKKKKEYTVEVSNRKYTREEANEVFNNLYNRTVEKVLGDNTDLANIEKDLNLISSYPNEGVDVIWEFEPYDESIDDNAEYFRKYQHVIDNDGKVNNYELSETEVVKGFLKFKFIAYINEKNERYESPKYIIDILVHSRKELSEKAKEVELKNLINTANQNSKEQDNMVLPTTIKGKVIKYSEKKDFSCFVILILFIIAAFLVSYKEKCEIKELEKKTLRSLVIDYPNIVSKLLIYLGCGMSCRNAFMKVAANYTVNIEKKIQKNSIAYDELVNMSKKLKASVPESICYSEYAKKINNKLYTKFISIIEQNLKNGNKLLVESLKIEVMDAFDERKLTALKLGEEASTKLIFPLMIMLGIVMIVVMVPALMAF